MKRQARAGPAGVSVHRYSRPITRNQSALVRKYDVLRRELDDDVEFGEACKTLGFVTDYPFIVTRSRSRLLFEPVKSTPRSPKGPPSSGGSGEGVDVGHHDHVRDSSSSSSSTSSSSDRGPETRACCKSKLDADRKLDPESANLTSEARHPDEMITRYSSSHSATTAPQNSQRTPRETAVVGHSCGVRLRSPASEKAEDRFRLFRGKTPTDVKTKGPPDDGVAHVRRTSPVAKRTESQEFSAPKMVEVCRSDSVISEMVNDAFDGLVVSFFVCLPKFLWKGTVGSAAAVLGFVMFVCKRAKGSFVRVASVIFR